MQKEITIKLHSVIKNKARNGRIACKVALEIANQFDLSPKMVGDAADLLKIKITACQLGCFGRKGERNDNN